MIVDLHPTEDQALIAESVQGLLRRVLPVDRLRDEAACGGAAERAQWGEFAGLGLFGLGLGTEEGGVGYGLPEEVLVARALGRNLAGPSILATMVAAHLADDRALRAGMAEGAVRAAFANRLPDGTLRILDGTGADRLVLADPGGLALLPAAEARDLSPCPGIDESLSVASARLDGAPPRLDRAAGDRASLLLAAYLVGMAQATRDMAVDYAGTRVQFGQPIGAFQAIKHGCADMAVRAAAAEAQCFHAAATHGRIEASGAEIASARLLAGEAALANAKANIQIHGGMGFTAECDAHLYLKRTHVVVALGSSRRCEQRRILEPSEQGR